MAEVTLTHGQARWGPLPPVCIICGMQADTHCLEEWSWTSGPGIPLTPLALWRSARGLKNFWVRLPVCRSHNPFRVWSATTLGWHVTIYIFVAVGAILLLDKIDPWGFEAKAKWLFAGLGIAGIVWMLILLRIRSSSIRAIPISEDTIRIAGVCQTFAEVVHKWPTSEK